MLENISLAADGGADTIEVPLWARGFYDGNPPPSTLHAGKHGMSEHRARLARFIEWQEETAEALRVAVDERSRLIEALGGEAVTAEKIADLVKADAGGLLAWVRDKAAGFAPDMLRAFERERLEQRLADDRHAREVASVALADAEHEIAILERAVAVLAGRKADMVRAVVVEEVDALGEVYLRQVGELADTFRLMLAARAAVGRPLASAETFTLPTFRTPLFDARAADGLAIGFGEVEMRQRGALWEAFAVELGYDPETDVRPYLDAVPPEAEFRPSGEAVMPVFLHAPNATASDRYLMSVAPAADLYGEQDPPAEWLDAKGRPDTFRVIFVRGRAEVPECLGRYMVKRGLAHADPAAAPAS